MGSNLQGRRASDGLLQRQRAVRGGVARRVDQGRTPTRCLNPYLSAYAIWGAATFVTDDLGRVEVLRPRAHWTLGATLGGYFEQGGWVDSWAAGWWDR